MNPLLSRYALIPCALSAAFLLSACANQPTQPATSTATESSASASASASTPAPTTRAPTTHATPPAPASQNNQTATEVGKAITSPLGDLNLVKADIPAVLAAARQAPYAAPVDRSCAALAEHIQALDAVLGADLDTPSTDRNPSLIERGAGAAKKGAIGAVKGAAEGIVPMRSWVRKLTGAEKYAREVEASITAGTIRRSYLKGLGQAAGCEAPAAPRAPVSE